jgi:PAS domain S-box-containing protein
MQAPPSARPPRGYSLRDRLLLLTLGIVVVLVGLTLGIIDAFMRQQVRREVAEELVTTGAIFERFLELRAGWMRRQSHVVAEDPRFSATLDLPDADPEALARTVLGEARRFQSILESELFIATDAQGLALAELVLSRPGIVDQQRLQETRQLWTMGEDDYLVTSVAVGSLTVTIGGIAGGRERLPDAAELAAAVVDLKLETELATQGSAGDVTARLQELFVADLAAVTDANGQVLDVIVRHIDSGRDLSSRPSIRRSLAGQPSEGLRIEGRRLFHVDVVPVWSPDRLVGTLTTGFEIDDALAGELRDMTRSHVSFFDHHTRLVASTWTGAPRLALEAQLRGAEDTNLPFEVVAEGETFLSHSQHFGRMLDGELNEETVRGTYLIQRSLDSAFAFLHTLEEVLLAVGVLILALAGTLSFLGARRITRPVGALVEGTRRLATGDLQHRIVAQSRSELGQLAESFNDMASALHRSREALEESERAYRDLFDNAQDLVFTTDLQHQILTVNKAGLAFLGYERDELHGRSLFDLVAPAQRVRVSETVQGVEPGAPRPLVEAALLRCQKTEAGATSEATFEILSRWIVAGGVPIGIHAIGRDITQRREREQATIRFREQLAQAEKLRALGEMAAGVAHNFNNLLTVVVGNAELISLHEDVPEPIRQDTQRILESARRCSAIVRRVQTFGRPIDMADISHVDLCQVTRDIVDMTSPKWRTGPELAGHTVSVELDLQPVPPILSQGSAWEEILSNLIFNAVDAMPEGGVITLSTRLEDEPDGDMVTVRVKDTGTGMDEETRRRIFEPFFSTKQETVGTGLGLSTVWGLVSTLGGTVTVESTTGVGTTFTMRMPVPMVDAPDSVGKAITPATVKGLRILVVDDEPRVLELLPPILAGHLVDTAAHGGEGLKRLSEADYDIVLSDWVMAEASGLEVAAEARSRNPDTVIVLMTGWDPEGGARDQRAIDLRLTKPFEREDVERVLHEAVTLWRQRQAGTQSASHDS